MSRGAKKPPEEVHTEVEIAEAKAAVDQAAEGFSDQVKEDSANPELAQHVRDLVGLFFQHEIQALEQRIADLELLVGQPKDAVQFTAPPEVPMWSNDPVERGDGVGWYQPRY